MIAAMLKESSAAVTLERVEQIRAAAGPIPGSALRKLLLELSAELNINLDPLVEGVRQDTFGSLERTLLALSDVYERHPAETRRLVITSKDHAKFAAKRAEGESKTSKEEMILWMLTWLENPGLFPQWIALRKRQFTEFRSTQPE